MRMKIEIQRDKQKVGLYNKRWKNEEKCKKWKIKIEKRRKEKKRKVEKRKQNWDGNIRMVKNKR